MTETLSVIMTPAEIEQAEEQSLEAMRDWLDQQEQKAKQRRARIEREPRTLRTREAAVYLGIREWKLRAMVFAGEIEVIRHNSWLFSVDDLDRWIRRNREKK